MCTAGKYPRAVMTAVQGCMTAKPGFNHPSPTLLCIKYSVHETPWTSEVRSWLSLTMCRSLPQPYLNVLPCGCNGLLDDFSHCLVVVTQGWLL